VTEDEEIEELASTVRFRRSEGGTVVASNTIENGEDKLIRIKDAYGDNSNAIVPENDFPTQVESNGEDALAQDDEGDVYMHHALLAESAREEKLETEVGSTNSRLNSDDNGMMPELKPFDVSGSTESSDYVEVDQGDHGTYDEDAAGHAKDEGFEAEIDRAVFRHDRENIDLSQQVKRPSRVEDRTSDGWNKKQDEAVADTLVSEHEVPNKPKAGDDGAYKEGAFGQSKHEGFETKIDNLGEADNLSPIQQSDSFDNGSESRYSAKDRTETGSEVEAFFDKLLDNSPSRKNLVEHNSPDHNNQHDDNRSIASSLTGMTTRGGSRASNWRGFSQRVLHPPCPLCSLVQIEKLIKTAIARMKQRKAKASRKSFRMEKRDTATRLVFA
jgi:hypothetical protein